MQRKHLVELHKAAGWSRSRRVALPKALGKYLREIEASNIHVRCCENLFGLILSRPDWDINQDRLIFDFGVFDFSSRQTLDSAIPRVIQDMHELKEIWGLYFDKPVPLLNNFRSSEGISENIFFDSSGSFFAMGDDLYKIGRNYWEAMDYLLAVPLPHLPVFVR